MNKLILLIAGVGGTALSATQLLLIFGVVFLHTQPAYSDETDAWKADYVIVYHGSSRSLRNLVGQGPNRKGGRFYVTPDLSTALRAAEGQGSGVLAYCVPRELAPEILGEEKPYIGLFSEGSTEYQLENEQAMKLHEYMHPDCKDSELRPRIKRGILNPLPRVKPRPREYPVDRLMMDEHFFNEIDWAILTGRHPSLLDEVLFEEAPGLTTPFVRSELPHGHLRGGVASRPPSSRMPSVSRQRPSRLSTSWLRGAQWFGFVYEAKQGKIEPDTTIPSGPAANLYDEFRRFSLNRIKQMGRCSGYDEDAQIQQGIIDQNRLHFFRVDSHLRAFKELDAFQQEDFLQVTDFPIIP